jgi:DNA-directed RNA polymerase specialized sigma54-like protein
MGDEIQCLDRENQQCE